MKSRHVRSIAVFAIVLVTLTGARRSGGGGCDDDNHNSSSSSSSGGFTSGGTTTGGDDDSSSITGGSDPDIPTFSESAIPTPTDTAVSYDEDVRDEASTTDCDYDETTSELTSTVTVTNPSTTDSYNYTITVKWEQTEYGYPNGRMIGTDLLTTTLSPGQTTTLDAEFPYFSQEAITFQCTVDSATKSIV